MSSLTYEKRQSKGTLVAIPEEMEKLYPVTVKLLDSIPLDGKLSKTYRKLLEMTTEKVALAFNDFQVVGLVDASLFDWKILFYGQKNGSTTIKSKSFLQLRMDLLLLGKRLHKLMNA